MIDANSNERSDAEYIQDEPGNFSKDLITVLEPASVAAEAYRTLRTNLFYAVVDRPPKVIVVTSPKPKDGKSVTCANLGVVLAQADKSTLVIDCDLRRPNIHCLFDVRNFRGLADILVKEDDPREVWQEPVPNLKVLTAGLIPPNPAELLGSKRFAGLLERMRDEFDYVLLDAPPVEMVSDPLILATQADGVLLVVNSQNTRRGDLRRSVRSLNAVEANILGTVMNNAKASGRGYYGRQLYA